MVPLLEKLYKISGDTDNAVEFTMIDGSEWKCQFPQNLRINYLDNFPSRCEFYILGFFPG